MSSPFEKALNNRDNKFGVYGYAGAMVVDRQIVNELVHKSGDPQGSPLERYLPPADVQTSREFLHYAHQLSYPNSLPMQLYVHRFRKIVNPGPPHLIPSWFKVHTTLMPTLPADLRGYKIGTVIRPTGTRPDVYLCSDGLLRCNRPLDIAKMHGFGVGVLPDPHHTGVAELGHGASGIAVSGLADTLVAALDQPGFRFHIGGGH